MTRDELLKSPEYWITQIQCDLYRQIENYMKEHHMNKSQLASYLGCSRGYVTQLLNGDFDHKISKLVELSLAIGMAPKIEFKELDRIDEQNRFNTTTIISLLPKTEDSRFVDQYCLKSDNINYSTEFAVFEGRLCANFG